MPISVMDSAIATITERPIYRGVNCIDLAEKDTLEHTATLLWDVTAIDPFAVDNCPHVPTRCAHRGSARRGPIDRPLPCCAGRQADPGAFTRAPDGRALVGARILRLVVAPCSTRAVGGTVASADRQGVAPDHKYAPTDPPRAGAARRSRIERLDLHVRCAASTGLNLYDA